MIVGIVIGVIIGFIIGFVVTNIALNREAWKLYHRADRCSQLYRCACRMMECIQKNKSFGETLLAKGIKDVAIYGYGALGKTIIRELENSECHVKYVIESKGKEIEGLSCYAIGDEFPNVGAVIVTPVWDFDNIKKQLDGKITNIFSLNEIFDMIE